MTRLQTGEVLSGKYRILKALGKGGEGSVWLAVHLQTVQLWAVKEILKRGDGQEFHEINMMKKLQHPSLPKIVDVLEDEAHCFLIMEYVRGRTLEEWLKQRKRFSPEEVLEVGDEISNVLCYLHGQTLPILHLDIKPATIIRKKNGRLVLVDFGAAQRKSGMTEVNQRRGTDGYAAPEQYDLSKPVDVRTDIYGLGATLYRLISGVPYSHALKKSRINGCPDYLGEVIKKCVQVSPGDRWESSRSLSRSLGRAKKKYYFEKQRYRFWIALMLLIITAGMAAREIPREFQTRIKEDWDYDRLLAEALCAGEEKSEEYYKKAVYTAPERGEAYLQYLHQADADAVFDCREEEFLRTLLHTIPVGKSDTNEEMLEENPEAYGAFASELGMIYWYDYEGQDGRKIAAGWFSKAVRAVDGTKKEEAPGWSIRAQIYSHMGSYYERLGIQDDSGEKENYAQVYWQELKQLLEAGVDGYSQPVTRLRFYQESLQQILFLAKEMQKTGIKKEELTAVVKQLAKRAENVETDQSGTQLEDELKQEIAYGAQTAEEILEHLENTLQRTDRMEKEKGELNEEAF